MADLSDVEAALVNIIGATIYPNGISQPSSLPGATSVRIDRGWPLPATLDADIAAGIAEVTVFPMPGTGTKTYQIQDQTYVVTPVSYGMSVSVNGNTITVSGQPNTGEYLTLICDGSFVYSLTGATTVALLAALATAAQANYPSASSNSTTLTVPTGHSLVVRKGGVATLGKVIHRQIQSIMVTVWAPTDAVRSAAASVIDIAIKENLKITMPDTSQAIVRYSRTNVTDDKQKAAIYRRDLIYDVEYATLQQFPGYVVTTVNTTVAEAKGATATALT